MTIKENIEKIRDDAENELNEQRNKINKFYTDIISIMAILIAAFSIIGVNISGIKFISENIEILPIWEYVISIATINLCLITSLFFMFLFLKKIVFPSKQGKQEKNIRKRK